MNGGPVATLRRVPRPASLTVYYDGACPLCRREVGFYRKLRGAERIDWIDVSVCADDLLPSGTTRRALLKRFHVRLANGALRSGAAGFVEIWARITLFKPLALLAAVPGMARLLEAGYLGFLRLRPRLQKWVTP